MMKFLEERPSHTMPVANKKLVEDFIKSNRPTEPR